MEAREHLFAAEQHIEAAYSIRTSKGESVFKAEGLDDFLKIAARLEKWRLAKLEIWRDGQLLHAERHPPIPTDDRSTPDRE